MVLTKNDIVQILSYTVLFYNAKTPYLAKVLNLIFMKNNAKFVIKSENAIL